MSWTPNARNDERKEEKPPFSRVFVVCSKQMREEDLRTPFQRYGEIEDIYMPRDRSTGDSKGIAYIKYHKTSSAAAAIQELHMKTIGNENKPVKVMIASNRNDNQNINEDKYKRLFIKVHRQATESEVRDHFSNFGPIESVRFQKEKGADENKGFAYVQYRTFLDAARAFEDCDKKYRAVFATPKDELKRSRNSLESIEGYYSGGPQGYPPKDSYPADNHRPPRDEFYSRSSIGNIIRSKPQGYKSVIATCSPPVRQKHMEALFNIVPGVLQCHYSVDTYNGFCKVNVTYEDESAAAHAVDRINNFEFPSGEIVSVKPDNNPLSKAATDLTNIVNNFKNTVDGGTPDLIQLADAIARASTLIKVATEVAGKAESKSDIPDTNYCNVPLPPAKPILNSNSRVAQRCFIVCKPNPPPMSVLKDVFCRFGDLIGVLTIPNKSFGFAKYASVKSAQDAIKTLNGATVCGVYLKVLEADERPSKDGDKVEEDLEHHDYDIDRKRMKLDDE